MCKPANAYIFIRINGSKPDCKHHLSACIRPSTACAQACMPCDWCRFSLYLTHWYALALISADNYKSYIRERSPNLQPYHVSDAAACTLCSPASCSSTLTPNAHAKDTKKHPQRHRSPMLRQRLWPSDTLFLPPLQLPCSLLVGPTQAPLYTLKTPPSIIRAPFHCSTACFQFARIIAR